MWKPGRTKAWGDTPNFVYAYLQRTDGPLAVTTRTLVDYGTGTNYVTAISLYDAMGQLRQAQTDDVSNPNGVLNRAGVRKPRRESRTALGVLEVEYRDVLCRAVTEPSAPSPGRWPAV